MTITGHIFIFDGHGSFHDRQLLAGIDKIRIFDLIAIGMPDLRPCEWIIIDLRFLCNVPEAITILAPCAYGIDHIRRYHSMLHLHVGIRHCHDAAMMIRNKYELIYPGQQLTIMKTAVTVEDKDMTGYRHRKH